ncbi:hypothetical protein PP175_23475 [Aneurinibacillus sp. Ricciae_BoGa-3]|uniref:hypothetical protein n=1 Tax=Aneurinibacillus sp. Ricciae_BoGa-3 TaxID=3022697 RepID=UPI00233FF4C3|nr:hypothetical protein [Aneurinibacillus sp. Ricciae_BoGa-3]WCK54213.1 hypothetical protein PP175_23475 [Aneurinibacillus sp. Ricciae_BoGa-3]
MLAVFAGTAITVISIYFGLVYLFHLMSKKIFTLPLRQDVSREKASGNPSILVSMLTGNSEGQIEHTVRSIHWQSIDKGIIYSVSVKDCGSTDQTVAITRKLRRSYPGLFTPDMPQSQVKNPAHNDGRVEIDLRTHERP